MCPCAQEHTIPQKFKGQFHQITEAFLQVYAVPLQGGLPAIYPEEENPAPVKHGIWCEIFVRAY